MYGKMQESGLTEISFDIHLSYLGPVLSVFLLLNFLGVHCREWLHFDGNYSSPSRVPSRLSSPCRAAVGDDCDILGTDMVGNVPFLRCLTGGAEYSAQHGKGALLMVLIIIGEDN